MIVQNYTDIYNHTGGTFDMTYEKDILLITTSVFTDGLY